MKMYLFIHVPDPEHWPKHWIRFSIKNHSYTSDYFISWNLTNEEIYFSDERIHRDVETGLRLFTGDK